MSISLTERVYKYVRVLGIGDYFLLRGDRKFDIIYRVSDLNGDNLKLHVLDVVNCTMYTITVKLKEWGAKQVIPIKINKLDVECERI